jgi:hypothetical protein
MGGATMSAIVLDAITLSMAELVREVAEPTGDLFYGRDLSCVSDLTEDLAEVAADSTLGIAQAAVRRLTTARGGLPDDPDYGLDVRRFCNQGTPLAELRDLAGMIRVEVAKDDRIEDAIVGVSAPLNGELAIEVKIRPALPGVAPFSLTLAVTSGAVLMEAIG